MFVSKRFLSVAAFLALFGCSATQEPYSSDEYFAEEFSASAPSGTEQTAPSQAAEEKAEPVTAEEIKPSAPSVSPSEISAKYAGKQTVIGQKVATIGRELKQLQEKVGKNTQTFRALKEKNAAESKAYYEYIAHINARLQIGTTPGNPELTEMWKQASTKVNQLDQNISTMARLATQVSTDSAMITYLLDTIRATFAISGAREEEHEQLRRMEDETNQTAVLLERLVSEINTQVARQQQYVLNERRNISTLALGIRTGQLFGANLADPTTIPTASVTQTPVASATLPTADIGGRRPLMVIRFDRRNIAYEQPLYQAIKTALEKRPSTSFEVVAVSPAGVASGNYEATKNAEAVHGSLIAMGLPAGRISMSKMQSGTIRTTEVHIYLK